MDPREEEDLRKLIRRELESREKIRGASGAEARMHEDGAELSAERQRVIEEEIEAFYRAKGGYRRWENEDGEVEWLTDAEIREREGQIPVDMEELEVGQRRVRNRMVAISVLAFVVVVLLFVLTRERTGSIQVICNVPAATIVLNGSATDFQTDYRLTHVPVGPQMISVTKYGYVPDGPANSSVDLKAGSNAIVVLKLKPASMDSIGRSK
jgi:hypothetical protein